MVFIYYHKQKVKTGHELGRPIKKAEVQRLEQKLLNIGWKNLRWYPSPSKDRRWVLAGKPPNYRGPYGDYYEDAIITIATPGKPWENSGEILVRDYLKGPVFESQEGVGWGYGLKIKKRIKTLDTS